MDSGPGKRENKNLDKFEKAEKPHLMKEHREMGLKQFSSISELLSKLKEDLHLSYHSFIKEFISEPNNGVTLLLDLLKVIQLSQTNIMGVNGGGKDKNDSRVNQNMFQRALADEHDCLLCLKLCVEVDEGSLCLVSHP